jgi:hypothetical protein
LFQPKCESDDQWRKYNVVESTAIDSGENGSTVGTRDTD